MFYTFNQNNSGGSFTYDAAAGIAQLVIVEAPNAVRANALAKAIGLYFDGCDTGDDCDCCGDRWYPVDDREGKPTPQRYGQDVFAPGIDIYPSRDPYDAFVHYAGGLVVPIKFDRLDI